MRWCVSAASIVVLVPMSVPRVCGRVPCASACRDVAHNLCLWTRRGHDSMCGSVFARRSRVVGSHRSRIQTNTAIEEQQLASRTVRSPLSCFGRASFRTARLQMRTRCLWPPASRQFQLQTFACKTQTEMLITLPRSGEVLRPNSMCGRVACGRMQVASSRINVS